MAQPALTDAKWEVEIKTKKVARQPIKYYWEAEAENVPFKMTSATYETVRAAKSAWTRATKKHGLKTA
jgi:hypothetical protein